jgi:aldose 1-epimerase
MNPTATPGLLPASGAQHVIEQGPYRAVVASVGATLRSLTYEGCDLVVPFGAEQVRPFYRGATLVPWPNRVVDGCYQVGSEKYQLPLNEPERSHALHGLVLWLGFQGALASPGRLALHAILEPQPGYPHRLLVEVVYTADAVRGLTWSVAATNLGTAPAPYGTGPHPYLVAGPSSLNEWALTLPAASFEEVAGPRLLPAGKRAVEGGPFDFRTSRVLGEIKIDHAFGDIAWDGAGRVSALLQDPSGQGVSISWGQTCPWVQIHTADQPDPANNRLGLAVEPMTCPPDAFNSGTDLVWLEPGTSHVAEWTIAAIR